MGAFKEMVGLDWLGSDTLLRSTSHRWGTSIEKYDRDTAFLGPLSCL